MRISFGLIKASFGIVNNNVSLMTNDSELKDGQLVWAFIEELMHN